MKSPRILEELGPAASQINVVFVSADPGRDTPDVLKRYIEAFDNRIIGVTGSEAEVGALAAALGASIRKIPQGSSYTVDHSIFGYLLDRDWVQRGTLYVGSDANRPRVLETLKGLINGTNAG